MSCSVIRNKQTGEIERVLAPNEKDSILFSSIEGDKALTKEQALRLWAKAYTPTFKSTFGDWEGNPDPDKVDANGEPLEKYVGSPISFNRKSENYKQVLSPENQKIFENLVAKGLVTAKRYNGMYFVKKEYVQKGVSNTFKDYRDGYWVDSAKVRQLQAALDLQQIGWLELEPSKSGNATIVKIVPDRQVARQQKLFRQVGNEAFTNIADRLSKRLGIPYEVIDAEKAVALTEKEQIPWNGEAGFAYKGKVYILEDSLSTENALHEYSHFFVKAVAKQSPYLVSKLYNQIKNDSEGKKYADLVEEVYSDFSEDDRKEETLVRALTDKAMNLVDEKTGNVIVEAVRKIWSNIKGIIRDLFGVSVKNLSEHTTLDQLSAILLGENDGKVLDLGDTSYFKDLFPLYSREVANELEKLSTSAVKTSITSFFNVASEHLERITNDPRHLSHLREIFANDRESTLIKDEKEMLKLAKDFAVTLEENTAVGRHALLAFSDAIEGLEVISTKMADHVATFPTDMSNQQKLAVFQKYAYMAKEWQYVLDQFDKAVQDSPIRGVRNPLTDSVRNTRDNYKFINDKIKEFYLRDGIVKALRDELEGNQYYNSAIEGQKKLVAKLEKEVAGGNKIVANKLAKEKELLRRYDLTNERILEYLTGEMGDTNPYSALLESYSSNPDPIVGTFSNWFFKNKFRAQAQAQERLTRFENRVRKIYKDLGFDPGDFRDVAKNLVQKETQFNGFKDGKPQTRQVYKLINQYGDDKDGVGWDHEYQRLTKEASEAKDRLGTPLGSYEEYRKKKQSLEQFKLDYMFDEESDKVKEARLFWFRDETTMKARTMQDDILDMIRRNSFSDLAKDESLEKADENKALWRQFSQLSSLRDTNGNEKTGEERAIAEAIQEYRNKYGDLYEQKEIKGMFEANARSKSSEIVDQLISEGKAASEEEAKKLPEYSGLMNEWYSDNIRITLNQNFYDKRNEIVDRIRAITSKMQGKENQELDISTVWKSILDVVKGYRDEEGQPIGSDLSDSQVSRVKELEQKILDIRETYNRVSGLTDEEGEEYFNLLEKQQTGATLDDDEFNRMIELDHKYKLKIPKADRVALRKAFDELKELQSKIATPYYAEIVNDFLAKAGSSRRITQFNAGELLDSGVIEPLLRTEKEFNTWWQANHIRKERFDENLQSVVQEYQRLYTWNRTVPNDKLFQSLLESKNFEGLLNYKSPYIEVKKDKKYYFRRLKPENVNKKGKETEWVTHDNKGNWLPKPTERSATAPQHQYMTDHNIPYAKDPRFENAKYLELRDSKEQNLYKLLEAYKEFHLETQNSTARYAKLGLEVPRLMKNSVETFSPEAMVEKPKEWWGNIKNWVGALLSRQNNDFELGTGNYDPRSQAQTFVLTDLMGNQINSIPVKYMSYIDPDSVSMDIGKAVSAYAVSVEVNKVLHDLSPLSNALRETLSDDSNKPKDLSTKKRNIIQILTSGFATNASLSANKKGDYNRLKSVNNFLARELEGQTTLQQFGPSGEKVINNIMKFGAWGSLGLNLFAATKNLISGRLQNNLEAVMGKNFTPSQLLRSNVEFSKLAKALINDYYSLGNKSRETQLFSLFDPMNTYHEKVGSNFSKTVQRDALDMRFVMSMQKFGEINIQGSAWLAMMIGQNVEFTDPDTKEKKQIPYLDAWTLDKEGVLQIKNGVDPAWGRSGSKFLQFTAKVHKVNELNQGAYSPESQPEIHRYTLGKLFLFMRKFYVPGAMNRFSVKRFNAALGDFREGYWNPLFDLVGTTVKSSAKGHIPSIEEIKGRYSPEEFRSILRATSELGTVGLLALMILALGFDGDDEDRYRKLAENSWIHNFAIYQLMLIKSEAETFIPFYGMGVNETVRFLGTPTIAFNTARRWVKVGQDLLYWTLGDPAAYYQKSSGIYSEGQVKFFADILNIIGYKNFAYLQSNEDLQQGLKIYAALQRRI